MSRNPIKLALFLLLGAKVNVAVAWGCAVWIQINIWPDPYRYGTTEDKVPYWSVEQIQHTGAMRYVWVYVIAEAPDLSCYSSVKADPVDPIDPVDPVDLYLLPRWCLLDFSKPPQVKYTNMDPFFIDDARGWPLLAMSSFFTLSYDPAKKNDYSAKSSDGFSLPESLRSQFFSTDIEDIIVNEWYNHPIIPLRPIWPGFIINTFFYATVLWLLAFVPFTARRMIRHKRNLCIKCGYDLRLVEHEVCPECGCELRAKVIS